MRHLGYADKIVRILESAYKDTFSAVRIDGDLTDWFATIVGVLQGCVLSPLLFNIFLEVIMALAMEGSEAGAVINGEIIGNLRFADDIATLAEKHSDLQNSVSSIFKVGKQLGLAINIDKTETQFLGKGEESFQIFIDGVELKQVEQFIYPGPD